MNQKIGIVTVHRCFNYGACLQAYATVKFLQKQGYDAEIIDYTNDFEQRYLKVVHKENGKLIGYITSFLKTVVLGQRKYYRRGLGKVEEMYPLSSRRFYNIEDMKDLNYDILVSGSDQIWNPAITNGLDRVFLLDFGTAKKRISIATSMGSAVLNKSEKEIFSNLLKKYTAISVREEYAKKQLEGIISTDIKILADPTLLLCKDEWIDLAKKSKYYGKKEKYILTYFVSPEKHSNDYQQRVMDYSRKFNLPVWTIQFGNYSWKASNKKILGASMEDFVALILNSQLFLTDSFHGVAFSVNLEKNFVAFKHKKNPMRTLNLLERFKIEDRIDMTPEQYKAIDYSEIKKSLMNYRKDSQNWIINVLE